MRTSMAIVTIFCFTILCQCSFREPVFEYIPLEDYKYETVVIEPGAEMKLLAFSQGRENDGKTINYYQFIVIRVPQGDTLRILTPLISVPSSTSSNGKLYTTPLQFDAAPGVTKAFYSPRDSSVMVTMNLENMARGKNMDLDKITESLKGKITFKEFVVLNHNIDLFDRDYPTAMGVLDFKEVPWYPQGN
jgi:hypothetical protein